MGLTVLINGEPEAVWEALTDPDKLAQWYAPGSPWEIPKLAEGEKATFTLMPSAHNHLTEKLPMALTIVKAVPNKEFAFRVESADMLVSFVLAKESGGVGVTANTEGFEMSLANLKALVEGKEIPFV
ncbi:SRPBCC family protein [Paenibacillus arenilitoris]|uniref:SRPBCC domain-containing protein n=1 Tax=Paenibacillus arenilitoris TaxID=2772299 RepID=A0A927H3M9_9BACL|nr:SRPBCC domain-containing protein [Paenibacillus arenilitoris]MBD2867511.1 SRPBCC domain-containing protein [Paenibacillus arenilitoris]